MKESRGSAHPTFDGAWDAPYAKGGREARPTSLSAQAEACGYILEQPFKAKARRSAFSALWALRHLRVHPEFRADT